MFPAYQTMVRFCKNFERFDPVWWRQLAVLLPTDVHTNAFIIQWLSRQQLCGGNMCHIDLDNHHHHHHLNLTD